MNDEAYAILIELASERARYEDHRGAGRVFEAIESRSHLHELRARIAYMQHPFSG